MTDTSILRRALTIGAFIACLAAPGTLSAQQRHGDVNGDGLVSALDAQAILTGIVGIPLPQGFVLANGDADCRDGTRALDAQIVLSFVIGLDVTAYCVNQQFGPGALSLSIMPTDTSVLVNNFLQFRAILRDGDGNSPQRPVVWSSSNPDLVAVDSSRADTVWVSNKGVATEGDVTLSATSDGVTASTSIRVFSSYQGLIIRPQRGDTIRQLNATRTFTVADRDSLGTTITTRSSTSVTWTVLNPAIASVNATGVVTALSSGTTMLRAVSNSGQVGRDSVPLVVMLPTINSCTGQGGTLYPSQTFTTPQTWTPETNPHYVAGTLTFNATSGLTIQPGTLVCLSSGASMTFQAGSQLIARGTPEQLIHFLPTVADQPWGGISFNTTSVFTGTTTDTSIITNAVFVRSGAALNGGQQHTLVMDSVHMRQLNQVGVRIIGPGSRFSRSTIDTAGASAFAVVVGRGTLEESTIRLGATGAGVSISDPGTIRNVTITGGTVGIGQTSGTGGVRINDVTISNVAGAALDLSGVDISPSSGNVQVTTSQYGYRGRVGNLAILYPDSVAQATLVGHASDTVRFTGVGAIRNRTLTLRPDLNWVAAAEITVDTQAVLRLGPGVRIAFQNAGIRVTNSGRLVARGSAQAPVWFGPAGQGIGYYGFTFENPPAPGGVQPPPRDTSILVNVQIDSAGNGYCGTNLCGAVNTQDRHVVFIDSARVRHSLNGGVGLAASGSRIARTVIDTSGNPTSGYPALFLGGGTLADTVTVRRSGQTGVAIGGALTDTVRIRAIRIEDSEGIGLHAEGARIVGDTASVIATANAYPFHGYFDNFGVIARRAGWQANLSGNTDNVAVIVGRSDRPLAGNVAAASIDTIVATPQLRWQIQGQAYIDTLARLVPQPGAVITFSSGGLHFRRGGRLIAQGTAAAPIRFEPAPGVTFNGLNFENPGAFGGQLPPPPPRDTSVLRHVRISQAGGLCATLGCASVATADRHVLFMDSSLVRESSSGGVHLAAAGSRIFATTIDTTLSPSYAALALGGGTRAESTTVRRSGGTGVSIAGGVTTVTDTIRVRGLRILNSVGVGLHAEGGRLIGDSAGVITSGNAYAFHGYIDNFAAIARDPASQSNLTGNVTDEVVIVGRSDRSLRGRAAQPDTLYLTPQLSWQFSGHTYVDTLARLRPLPGARLGFNGAALTFRTGGRLLSLGTMTDSITFTRHTPTSGNFNGIEFVNAAGTGLDTSIVLYSRIISVQGGQCATFGCAALAANDRHVLLVDSSLVAQSANGAIHVAAPGSKVLRSIIDQSGNASYAALALGRATLAEDVTVSRSTGTGVQIGGAITALGDTVRMRRVTIADGSGVGLHAEGGRLLGDPGSVTITRNAYPFHGYIDNFAAIAKDSVSQLQLLGNTNDEAVIVGSASRPFTGRIADQERDTLRAIRQLRWHVAAHAYIDSLGVLKPGPGARIGFSNAGMTFQRGGRLYARASFADSIVFEKQTPASGNFNGLRFENAGGGLLDTSIVVNVRVRTIQGTQCAAMGCSALAPEDRHVLIVDSSRVSQSVHGAVHLAAPGSRVSRTAIDTSGSVSYAALALNRSTLAETTTVRRAGGTAVLAGGAFASTTDTLRVRGLTILNGLGAALQADGGRLMPEYRGVVATENAYPYYGFIDNLAALVPDAAAQGDFLGNTDNVAVIVGNPNRALRGDPVANQETPLTLQVRPELRFEFQQQNYIDTLARFEPLAGANITFASGGLVFQRGGDLRAVGTQTDTIRFRPARSGVNFFGLMFSDPPPFTDPLQTNQPVASSTLQYVQLDSASGQSGGFFGSTAAIVSGGRHHLTISNALVRRSLNGAMHLGAKHTTLTSVRVDTTGNPTTTISAVALNDSISLDDVRVYRSGGIGMYFGGRGTVLNNVVVRQGLGVGMQIDENTATGSRGLSLTGFVADSNALGGVFILADSVSLSSCVVRGNGTTSAHHGISTNAARVDVVITNCDLVNNAGNGVHNAGTTTIITATTNYWGSAAGAVAGDGVSANVEWGELTGQFCQSACSGLPDLPVTSGSGSTPALPPRSYGLQSPRRRRRGKARR